ncbi:hypothetical protein niasHT_027754 [Heterodera trifolii]|uniref:Tetraspanin n=1 Tax=Heterodera trifolii TaxID=157864 RepID=A0ABD2KIW9_9BILA
MTSSAAASDDYRRMFFEMNGEASSSTSNYRLWSKYTIYAVNIIFMVVGTLVLATGAWLRTDSRFRDFLSERYRQAVHEAFWEAPTLYAFSYIMILLGAALLLLAMFGCCGVTATSPAQKRTKRQQRGGGQSGDNNAWEDPVAVVHTSPPLLWLYTVGAGVLLMFTIGCGCYILYTKDGIDVELSDALNYMVQHYYQGPGIVQETLDRLQQAFRCCGNAGCSDFRAFRQDPPRTCDLRCDGCHYRIWLALRIGFSVALAIFGIVILAQMAAISVSLILLCTTEEDDYDIDFDNGYGYGWTTVAQRQPPPHHYHQNHYYHGANAIGHAGGGGGAVVTAMRSLGHATANAPNYQYGGGGRRPSTSSAEIVGNMYDAVGGGGTHAPSRQQWHYSGGGRMPHQRPWDGQRHHFLSNNNNNAPPSSFHYY